MRAALELHGVRSGYGTVEIIHGVDLRVGAGETVALLGPNGAGKSTLVRTIAGLLPCWQGTIHVDGDIRLDAMPAHRRIKVGVGVVPEGRTLFRGMSVRENLLLGGHGDPSALDHVLELFPALGPRTGQLAGTLSGGEQQMLAIGRSLMGRPHVLVLDEPSLGLAPVIVQEILARLPVLANEGTAVILAEQNARQALEIADTAVVLERGHVVSARPAVEARNDEQIIQSYLGGVA